jgi:hypothetical protein
MGEHHSDLGGFMQLLRTFVAVMAVFALLSLSPMAQGVPTATGDSAPSARAIKGCKYHIKAKGMKCRRAVNLVAAAVDAFWADDSGKDMFRVGNFKCDMPAGVSPVYCHHREYPKRKWARQNVE